MKILIIDNSPGVTGALKSISDVAEGLKHDFDFYFALHKKNRVNMGDSLTKRKYFHFIEVAKKASVVLYPFFLLWNSIEILLWIRRERIHIVHVNDIYNLVGVVVKVLNPKVKLVYHVRLLRHSYIGKLYRTLNYIVSGKADRVICVSKTVFDEVSNSANKRMIYDGVEVRENLEIKKKKRGKVELLFPANYIPGKGHEPALDAFLKARESNADLTLKFVGSDMGVKKNKRFKSSLIRKTDPDVFKSGSVEFCGFVENIKEEIKKSDIVLMFSESESFSRVCVEAAAEGKPVIATRCGGSEEIIVHNKSGILVDKGSVEQMVQSIVYLVGNEEVRTTLGAHARRRCKSFFSLEKMVNRHKELYLEL